MSSAFEKKKKQQQDAYINHFIKWKIAEKKM